MFVSLISIAVTLAVVGIILWIISTLLTGTLWFYKPKIREYGDLFTLPIAGIMEIPRMLACVLFGVALILAVISHFG